MGHAVTTVTGFPNYPEGRIYRGDNQRLWLCETVDGIRLLRLNVLAAIGRCQLQVLDERVKAKLRFRRSCPGLPTKAPPIAPAMTEADAKFCQ